MEITESQSSNKVVMRLDFVKPFESSNTTVFTIQPKGDLTEVQWVMSGPSPFISKLMSLVFSMDSIVGKDFEKGFDDA